MVPLHVYGRRDDQDSGGDGRGAVREFRGRAGRRKGTDYTLSEQSGDFLHHRGVIPRGDAANAARVKGGCDKMGLERQFHRGPYVPGLLLGEPAQDRCVQGFCGQISCPRWVPYAEFSVDPRLKRAVAKTDG